MRFLLSIPFLIAGAIGANAQQAWKVEQLTASNFPTEIVTETRSAAPNDDSIPDGLLATSSIGDIREAWYSGSTSRYTHGILGDAIEAGILKIKTQRGKTLRIVLPREEVFEDLTPRLVDLDDDGKIEVVTIRSSLTKGAAVTVYGIRSGFLVKKASTNFIGRKNRWLNIAGIEKYAGVRGKEIAYVITPHIGGDLAFIKYFKGKLLPIAKANDFSNHVIGSTEMRLSASFDVTGDGRPELAVPSADRTKLHIVSIGSSGPKIIESIQLPAPIDKAIATPDTGSEKGFTVGLSNGEVYQVSQ